MVMKMRANVLIKVFGSRRVITRLGRKRKAGCSTSRCGSQTRGPGARLCQAQQVSLISWCIEKCLSPLVLLPQPPAEDMDDSSGYFRMLAHQLAEFGVTHAQEQG